MDNLYQTILSLCEERGITGYRLCKDIGMTPGALTDLKMGRKQGLSAKNASKIADYFGVSVGYLLGQTEQKQPERQVRKEDILFALARGREDVITEEMYQEILSFADYVVQREAAKRRENP